MEGIDNIIEKKKLNFKNIKMIRNGGYHNLLLFNENGNDKLFGFGSNEQEQLGFNGKSTSELFGLNFFENKKISDIKCGNNHNLVLISLIYLFF